VLEHLGQEVNNPFYEMAPDILFIPLIVVATAATIVASQALISGVFSVTHQGIQLGFLPRLTVVHTSSDLEGQVYVPQANWLPDRVDRVSRSGIRSFVASEPRTTTRHVGTCRRRRTMAEPRRSPKTDPRNPKDPVRPWRAGAR
jgi:KUP system potassium uptake protein